ncbi:NAD-dependent epimerase/dehydratase family protein [Companilactobacillus huachuanensis]|uniref:NAD-dependent epimerase/dehydratase family protein n=1 Tax=Companilactobacillus huachuanensis TaxID=2559914 RepID=A0ABW1RLQ7_9LACO|nr:NAD-dependent epimerase/dehydratase family protein [Companilactobacillus huachuanensis]
MTTNIVLLGGNGYIGRELTKRWQQTDSDAEFWILSRSGRNQLTGSKIHNYAVNIENLSAVKAILPIEIAYVVDLIGRPEKDPAASKAVNDDPAKMMATIATEYHVQAMGFVGGKLGPKQFLMTKTRIIEQLQKSSVPLAFVEPTLVYGAGRSDSMSKLVPLLKVVGTIIPNMKPVLVDNVVDELREKLLATTH